MANRYEFSENAINLRVSPETEVRDEGTVILMHGEDEVGVKHWFACDRRNALDIINCVQIEDDYFYVNVEPWQFVGD